MAQHVGARRGHKGRVPVDAPAGAIPAALAAGQEEHGDTEDRHCPGPKGYPKKDGNAVVFFGRGLCGDRLAPGGDGEGFRLACGFGDEF